MSLDLLPVSVSTKIVDQKELLLKLSIQLAIIIGGVVSNIKIIRVPYVLYHIL